MDSPTNGYHHGNLREALLQRAMEVISRSGVGAVSLRSLARDLKVSHAAPTRHFPSRADLLATIAEEGLASLLASAAKSYQKVGGTAVGRLKAMAKDYIWWARSNPVYHLILRNQDVTRYAGDELRARLREYSELKRSLILQAIKEGWRASSSPELLLLQIVGLTAGLAVVATDPLYEIPLKGVLRKKDIEKVIDDFFE